MPDVEPPSEALVQVEIRALGSELVFHRANGTLFSRLAITGHGTTADVPVNSSVTVVRPMGHLIVGGRPVQFHAYTTATALADGDVIDLIPPEADLPAVQVTLPALPADAPKVTAYWCGRAQESAGGVLELARDRCGTRRGALFIAGAAAPLYGMIVPDLGTGTIDLSAGTWIPIAPVAVTLHPAPSPDRVWLVGGGAVVDNQVVRFSPTVAATDSTVMVPMFTGGAVTASLGQSGSPATLTRIAETRLDAAPFTLSVPDDAFPALAASMTGPRALTLRGDFATHRAVTQITATVADESNQSTWQLQLRGDDVAFTFPSEGLAPGTIRRIDLEQGAPTVARLTTRRLSF